MSNDDLIYSLARQCARGTRQLSFVNELLSWNEVHAKVFIPPVADATATWIYGHSQLSSASWNGLKQRLVTAGFVIAQKRSTFPGGTSVTLDHPARRSK